MLRATWTSLLARRVRLLLSAVAVTLGVAFVAGSLVFTDTLSRAFDGIVAGTVGDVVVRPAPGPGGATAPGAGGPARVDPDLVAALAALPGASRADGMITDSDTYVIGADGRVVGGQGAPSLGVNVTDAPAGHGVAALRVVEGRVPEREGEVALDPETARKAGYAVGDPVRLAFPMRGETTSARLVGTVGFGEGALVGATLTSFDTATAQALYLDGRPQFTGAWVTAADGVSQEELREAVAATLPPGLEAVTGEAAAAEEANAMAGALSFITTFLLVFAGIALLVGSFLIVNTFSVLVAQRTRELALLRAIGASRGQVSRSVLAEAVAVGLVGSTAGLGLGLGLAQGIRALFGVLGLDLAGAGLVVSGRTVLAAYAVGVVMTVLAAYLPARRAGRCAPVAVMHEGAATDAPLRRRLVVGGVVVALGATAIALGLLGDDGSPLAGELGVGLGSALVLLGVAATSPVVGRPVVRATGALFRGRWGTVGAMAERNALRSPRRTAATASALMIGLALVSLMSVLGSSAKASVDRAITQNLHADYVVSSAAFTPYSAQVTEEIADLPGVARAASYHWLPAQVAGEPTSATSLEPVAFGEVFPVDMVDGVLADLDAHGVVVEAALARDRGLAVGDALTVTLGDAPREYEVVGIFRADVGLPGPLLVHHDALPLAGVERSDSMTFVTREPSANPELVRRGIDGVVADLPMLTVKDQEQFSQEQQAPVDQLLMLVYALLALAVVIAVLGIVNTLALAVIERTREIGLLRAVGLGRGQLRTMLRLEAVAVAVLGAVLGVVLGTGSGVALQRTLEGEGIEVLAVPYGQLAAFVAAAAAVGVLAALWPARRAARLDVLGAVTAD